MCLEIKCYFLDQWLKISKHVFFPRENLTSLLVYQPSQSAATWCGKDAITAGPCAPLLIPEALPPRPESRRMPFPGS